ncbi:MAG: mandelate racemase [Planctomycetia bacterium]|nr:mandelate racemase [Planctomycetia bacterium]
MPRIARIETFPITYPTVGSFKFFAAPRGLPAGRRTVVVKLTDDEGLIGWGQAVPSPRWSYETPETVRSTIDLYLAPELVGLDLAAASEIELTMQRAIAPGFSTGQPIAKAAIDLALWDLRARRAHCSVASLLMESERPASLSIAPQPITLSWTLNPTDLADAERSIAAAQALGYRNFNLKVAPDIEFDVALCRTVRRLAPDAFIWADANAGYDVASALAIAPQLADLGIAALEQPLPANRLNGYRQLRAQRALPILMDESIVSTTDFDEFHRLGLLDGVAVKIARMGGLTEAWRLVRRLRETGSLFYASGLTDPDLSLAASLQLFACGGLALPAALNGPQFLSGSILRQPLVASGDQLYAPAGLGLGVEVDEDRLRELSELPH